MISNSVSHRKKEIASGTVQVPLEQSPQALRGLFVGAQHVVVVSLVHGDRMLLRQAVYQMRCARWLGKYHGTGNKRRCLRKNRALFEDPRALA